MWCESWQHVFFEFNVFVPMQLDDSNDVFINSCHVTLIDGLKICRARHASKNQSSSCCSILNERFNMKDF